MNKKLKLILNFTILLFTLLVITIDYVPDDKSILENELEFDLTPTGEDTSLFVGYSKASIIPNEPVRLAGYGLRDKFEGINDSIFVKSVVLVNSIDTIAYLSFDLMVLTPSVSNMISSSLAEIGINQIYFTTSHSHSSIGGYGNSFIEKIILGGQEEAVFNKLKVATLESVNNALDNLAEVDKIFTIFQEYNSVKNRLTEERNQTKKIRNLLIKTDDGESIKIMSAVAHPTIIEHKSKLVSNDYPGYLCSSDTSSFTIFSAGIMGSTAPIIHDGKTSFNKAKNYAIQLLGSKVVQEDQSDYNGVSFNEVEFIADDFGVHFTENLRLRTWVFNLVFGRPECYIKSMRIGNNLFVGVPVELSADYYGNLEIAAKKKGLNLFLTSFNGTYLGYAPHSKDFYIEHMETRSMNWMGKYAGDYFEKIILKIIEKQ